MTETLEVSLFRPVDVQMVRVGRGDDAHPGTEPVEGPVELVGLDYDEVAAVGQYVIGAVVFGNAAEEGIAVQMTLMHDVCAHGRCGCFSMCTGKAKPFVCAGERAEYLCAFLDFKTVLMEVNQFRMGSRNGGSEDNQCRCRLPAFFRNEPDILFIVDIHPFFFQLAGQF